jgi:hypothetical protein
MLSMAGVGALVAAGFGVVHDEITCAISADYFTKMKFPQFHAEQFALPFRGCVAVIGVLASWWVGLLAGWVLARLLQPLQHVSPWGVFLKLITLIFFCAAMGGAVGAWFPQPLSGSLEEWTEACQKLAVADIPAFLKVAGIHQGSYIGAGIGFLVAVGTLWRWRQIPPSDSPLGHTPASR